MNIPQEVASQAGHFSLLGPISGAIAGITMAASVLTKVPEGQRAIRIHNGQATRAKDSVLLPEWRQGTLFGVYGPGWHVTPPGLHNFVMLSVLDQVTPITTKIKNGKGERAQVHDVGATVFWGVPTEEEYHALQAERASMPSFDVSHDTILLRALLCAGEKMNDNVAREKAVAGICKAHFKEIMQDYDDPANANSAQVHDALVELAEVELIRKGTVLRNTLLEETVPSPEQISANGRVKASGIEAGATISGAHVIAGAVGKAITEGPYLKPVPYDYTDAERAAGA